MVFALNGCSGARPVMRVDQSDSALKNAVYEGETRLIVDATELASYPLSEQYRVYALNAAYSGYGGIPVARDFATQSMLDFCRDMKKEPKVLIEQTAVPPYLLGNYPFIEITFACIDKATAKTNVSSGDDRYNKISQLKSLLDSKAITQDEFDKEKNKILNK
jgi:hypothetical protein